MDEAYNKHSRKNRSFLNPNISSMALPSSRLTPLDANLYQTDGFPFYQKSISINDASSTASSEKHRVHFSAPTSPGHTDDTGILTPIGSDHRAAIMGKSKSHTHICVTTPRSRTLPCASTFRLAKQRPAPLEHHDSDWIPRAGALLANSARESKGQSWIISRDSSTSLAGPRNGDHFYDDEDVQEREKLRAERTRAAELKALARRSSRPASALASPVLSRHNSRFPSRTQSRVNFADVEDDVHNDKTKTRPQDMPGPDFVKLEDRLEAEAAFREYRSLKSANKDDEATIRRLVRDGAANSSWLNMIMGWDKLPEGMEDDEDEEYEGLNAERGVDPQADRANVVFQRHFEGVSNVPEPRMPAPKADEGGWSDAAWLLSVMSKVIL